MANIVCEQVSIEEPDASTLHAIKIPRTPGTGRGRPVDDRDEALCRHANAGAAVGPELTAKAAADRTVLISELKPLRAFHQRS